MVITSNLLLRSMVGSPYYPLLELMLMFYNDAAASFNTCLLAQQFVFSLLMYIIMPTLIRLEVWKPFYL
jgi:hypothetical protein